MTWERLNPQCVGDRWHHEINVPHGGQGNPDHIVGKLTFQIDRELQREPRLANPANPCKCDQAHAAPHEVGHARVEAAARSGASAAWAGFRIGSSRKGKRWILASHGLARAPERWASACAPLSSPDRSMVPVVVWDPRAFADECTRQGQVPGLLRDTGQPQTSEHTRQHASCSLVFNGARLSTDRAECRRTGCRSSP